MNPLTQAFLPEPGWHPGKTGTGPAPRATPVQPIGLEAGPSIKGGRPGNLVRLSDSLCGLLQELEHGLRHLVGLRQGCNSGLAENLFPGQI